MAALRVPLVWLPRRSLALTSARCSHDPEVIRNFGLAAHIDAGKTTTTESVLMRTGAIRRAGSVDHGDTVTDFTELERQRGISIGAAAAAHLPWRGRLINLIDTPGHADFTLEVERSLRVLDGAVLLLDAIKGVQAQTHVVWRQAVRHRHPTIAFANKMDRASSRHLARAAASVRAKLGIPVLPLELPVFDANGGFTGVIDIVRMRATAGDLELVDLEIPAEMHTQAVESREELMGQLSELDETFAEAVVGAEAGQTPSEEEFLAALRRITCSRRALPLLCGSAKLHIGVSSLLDACTTFLPSPPQRHADFLRAFPSRLCGFAFKTTHDRHRGVLTFIRVYGGCLRRGEAFFNSTQGTTERVARLFRPLADMFEEVKEAGTGDIVVVSGLKHTRTGDVILGARDDLEALRALPADVSPVDQSLVVPEPVMFASIEAPSRSKIKMMDLALQALALDDPSLHVILNPETNQTVLAGMGDLHLEVTVDRLKTEYGVDARLGEVAIAYREAVVQSPEENRMNFEAESKLDAGHVKVSMEASIEALPVVSEEGDAVGNEFLYPNSESFKWSLVDFAQRRAIEAGARRGLTMAGPLLRSPITGARLRFHSLRVRRPRDADVIGAILTCAAELTCRLVARCSTTLLEPVMRVEVALSDDADGVFLSRVMSDLAHRRARIRSVNDAAGGGEKETFSEDQHNVVANVPLAELVGYAGQVRKLTSGRAELHLHLEGYEAMDVCQQEKLLIKLKY